MEHRSKNKKTTLAFQKTADNSFYRASKHESFHKKGFVHFNLEKQPQRTPQHLNTPKMGSQANFKKPVLKTFSKLLPEEQDQSEKTNTVLQSLMSMNILRQPHRSRKNHEQHIRMITDLLNSPIISKSAIIRELKCLMSNSSVHESYLLDKKFCKQIKAQLRELNSSQIYRFRYQQLAFLLKNLQQKKYELLVQSFDTMLQAYTYPPSVQLMLLYMGIHLYTISSQYTMAQSLCNRMYELLLKKRIDRYIPIYYILMIRIKANLGQWNQCLVLISRNLTAAWIMKQNDLEIWCYFEMSRAHFALGNIDDCQFFKTRSEMSVLEGQTIYRQMMSQAYLKEIELLRNHNYTSSEGIIISQVQLSKNPERGRPIAQLKAQVYAKTIVQNFKIKHVKNLIGRLGEEFTRVVGDPCLAMAGNPQFLTHQSGIKNLNIHFRGGEQKQFYTLQNSTKNTLILRQMIKNTLLQMKWYVPIVQHND